MGRWWILMKRKSVTKDVARREAKVSSTLATGQFHLRATWFLATSTCRIALRLWIIDFPSFYLNLERKESNERLEQPFSAAFSRYFNLPPLRSRLFAAASRVLVIEWILGRRVARSEHMCIFIYSMLFLRHVSHPRHCCCCCFMYVRYSYEFMKKIRSGFLYVWFSLFQTTRTGEKFLNLPFFFSRPSLDQLILHRPPNPVMFKHWTAI